MFQPKARRVVPVLALTAALSLLPLADASAARGTTGKQPSGLSLLAAHIEAQISTLWAALQEVWSDAGVRLDDNG